MQAVYAQGLQRERALRCCVCLLKLAPNRPSTEKGENFSPFSGHQATARQLGDLMRELALQRLSDSVVKLTTEAGSHATARRLGDLMLKLAPHRPSTEKAENLSAFSGHQTTARQVGDLRQAKTWQNFPRYQREPKCAPLR